MKNTAEAAMDIFIHAIDNFPQKNLAMKTFMAKDGDLYDCFSMFSHSAGKPVGENISFGFDRDGMVSDHIIEELKEHVSTHFNSF